MAVGKLAQTKPDPCSFVIFGVTGDLAHRLVVPALYNLAASDLLPDKFCVVGVARGGMSGEELASEVRRRFPRLPVVIASGYGRSGAQAAGMQAEGLQFVSKPYSSVDLQQALDHAARMAVPS